MTINFDALQTSLNKIGQLGQGERTFKAGDSTVTVRVLHTREEIEVDKYAQVAWEEATGDEDRAALADYVDRMRIGTLSHVLVQIDDLDLRNVEFIETGEEDENGNKVKRPRYEAVRDLIYKWSRPVLHVCYVNYGALVTEVEASSSKAIESTEADITGEVSRLQSRLDHLKRLQEQQKAMDEQSAAVAHSRETMNELGQIREDQISAMVEGKPGAPESTPEPEAKAPETPPERPKGPRQPATPRRSGPPVRTAAQPQPSQPQPQPEQPPTDAGGYPLPHDGDSFFDPSDGDAAVAAEHKRLEEIRRRSQEQQPSPQPEQPEVEEPVLEGAPRKQKPPHREALNTANAVLEVQGEKIQGKPPSDTGKIEGVRLPTETLRERGKEHPRRVAVNQPGTGSRNPRFKQQ